MNFINPRNWQIAQPGMSIGQERHMQMVGIQNLGVQNVENQNGLIVVSGIANQNMNGNGNIVTAKAKGNANRNNADLNEIEEVNANCILMANLQQASTSEEQYIELLEPIPEPHQVQQNDSNVIYEVSNVNQDGRTVEQHPATVKETRAYFESLYNNLAIKVEKVNTVNQFSDDTTLSVAQKFLNEEIHRIVKDEIFLIVNQVDARVQNFKIQFLKEATEFIRDYNSLAKEADESLAKHKALELEIGRLLRSVVSQDIMSVVQHPTVVETSNLQTKLERTK
nr:hypothetical protein [Tanacetum cinerariifolium]